jgi:outer membrane protein
MKVVFYVVIIVFAIGLFSCSNERRHGYVELAKLFDEFEYTKELQKEIKQVNDKRKFVLDSIAQGLEMKYKLFNDKNNVSEEFRREVQEFNDLKSRFKNTEDEISKAYDEKIYKQINQYVKEFGEINHYAFIHGANGSGNIMYADSSLNITKDLIVFINKKYRGK